MKITTCEKCVKYTTCTIKPSDAYFGKCKSFFSYKQANELMLVQRSTFAI